MKFSFDDAIEKLLNQISLTKMSLESKENNTSKINVDKDVSLSKLVCINEKYEFSSLKLYYDNANFFNF